MKKDFSALSFSEKERICESIYISHGPYWHVYTDGSRMQNIFCCDKDFMAGMKTLVGGEIKGYTEMLVEARQIATKRMVDEAEAMGADAIVNIRFGSSAVMQGAAEVIAYGTAVKLK